MLLPLLCLACDGVSRPDDTLGLQSSARWEWHGRLVVEPDSALTLVRMAIDTAHGGHDVGLARYDFNPAVGEGDEYSLTLALDLETVRDLRQNVPYMLGPPPAHVWDVHARPPARAHPGLRDRDVSVSPAEAGLGPRHVHARDARAAADHGSRGRDPVFYGMERRRPPRELSAASAN